MSITFSFFFISIVLIPNYIFAKSLVVFVRGDVSIISTDGKKYIVRKGLEVLDGDEIITGDDSLVVLKIEGHSVHKVDANSKLKVSSLPIKFQNSNLLQSPASIVLKGGTILSHIIKQSDNESLTIKAESTSMGVRGTQIMTSLDDSQNLVVVVNKGSVEFSKGAVNDLVEEGETLIIENDKRIKSLGATELTGSIKWKFNSVDLIVSKNEVKHVFMVKRARYKKNIERWDDFKAKRLIEIKSWNKNTNQLMKRLVKKKRSRRQTTYVNPENLFKKDNADDSKHINLRNRNNKVDLHNIDEHNRKRERIIRKNRMRRKKILTPSSSSPGIP